MRNDPRLLPQDLECERVLIGVYMVDREAYRLLRRTLQSQDFALEKHRRIWLAMEELYADLRPIDRITVCARLDDKQQLELVGGLDYLCQLDGSPGTIMGFDEYAIRVKRLSAAREAIVAMQKLSEELNEWGADATHEILGSGKELFERIIESIEERREQAMSAAEIIAADGGIGAFLGDREICVPTPFEWLNNLTGGGLHAGELVILAARPSVGKSAVAGQFTEAAALAGKTSYVFSLEMSAQHVITRMACSRADVDSLLLRRPDCPPVVRERFRKALNEISAWPIFYDRTGASMIADFEHVIRGQLTKTGEPGLVVIDYLQLVNTVGKSESRNYEIGVMTRLLKKLAIQFKCPFLVLSQLSRPENDTALPTLRSLRDSGCIEQDADLVLIMHQDPDQKQEPYRLTHVELAKQRNGPIGYSDMIFDCVRTRLISKTHVAAPPPPEKARRDWDED